MQQDGEWIYEEASLNSDDRREEEYILFLEEFGQIDFS